MKIYFIISFILFLQTNKCDAQVSITGPTCAVAFTEYQYIISGNETDSSIMKVCVEGGIISGTQDSCTEGQTTSLVRIIWNATANASLSVSNSSGDAVLNISITTDLEGGKIDSTLALQIIHKDSLPSSIICLPASGGSCSPHYNYQWQQSYDNLRWEDVLGFTSENFDFQVPVIQTTYLRRKVSEIISNSVNYSNVSTVAVIPEFEQAQN